MWLIGILGVAIFFGLGYGVSKYYDKKIGASRKAFLTQEKYNEYKEKVKKFYEQKDIAMYTDVETVLGLLGYCVLDKDTKTDLPDNKVIRIDTSIPNKIRQYQMATFVASRFIPKEEMVIENKNDIDEVIAKKAVSDAIVGLILIDEKRFIRDMEFQGYDSMPYSHRMTFVKEWAKNNDIVLDVVEEIAYRISIERGCVQ